MKKIVQVAHVTKIPGPVQILAEYIQEKKDVEFYQILHPLNGSGISHSEFLVNKEKLAQKKTKFKGLLEYADNYFETMKWLKRVEGPIDTAIGMNPFDALPLILLKRRLKIRKVVLFGTDFSRKRFKNPMVNSIYVRIDRFCAKKADLVCCNTRRAIEARMKEGVFREKLILTPNGVFWDKIGIVPKKRVFEKKLVYIGHLSKSHGLADIIKLISGTNLRVDIIGLGPAENELRNSAKEYKVAEKIIFLGKLSHDQVIEYLKSFSGLALAPYNLEDGLDLLLRSGQSERVFGLPGAGDYF